MVAAGLVAPIALTADLHQPARAWHFYAQTRFGSVMWYGAYLLPLFSLLSMLLGWLLLRPALARRGAEGDKIARLARLLCLGSWSGHVWQRPLSLLAAVSGLSIAPTPGSRPWRWRRARSGIPLVALAADPERRAGGPERPAAAQPLAGGLACPDRVDPAAPERLDVGPAGALPCWAGPCLAAPRQQRPQPSIGSTRAGGWRPTGCC